MSDTHNFRKFWWFHGVELTSHGDELQGTCPFCNKEEHFFVNAKTGLWNCKVCGEEGNSFTGLTKLTAISDSSPESLAGLMDDLGLKAETLQYAGVIKSVISGEYAFPVRNTKGNVVNLYKTAPGENGGGFQILSSPSPCKQQLYLGDKLRDKDVVYVCEGHKDSLAWLEVLSHLRQRGETIVKRGRPDYANSLYGSHDVVGLPGATTFLEDWVSLFSRKQVVLLLDNDKAGQTGTRKAIKMFRESNVAVASLRVLQWRRDDPNDIRDLVLQRGYPQAWADVHNQLADVNLDEADDEAWTVEPIECITFQELLTYYDSRLLMTDAIRDTLACMLAMVLSVTNNGTQLGLRVIGPPGSVKSTLAESISCCRELVYPTSKFTGLISGWGSLKKSNQIASRMNGRNVLVKDADMPTQMSNWPQVESEIRDALGDGVIRADFKTGLSHELETNFSMTLCGTNDLKRMDSSHLGSRFLDIDILEKDADTKAIVRASMRSEFMEMQQQASEDQKRFTKTNISVLGPPTVGFLLHKAGMIRGGIEWREPTELRAEQIWAMAELIVRTRAKVSRVREDLEYRPDQELATRASNQLLRFGMNLSLVLGTKPLAIITRQVLKVLQRITRSTCRGFQFEVIESLYSLPEGMTAEQVGWKLGLKPTQSRHICEDLLELGVLARRKTKNLYGRGRKQHWFILSDELREIYRLAFSER